MLKQSKINKMQEISLLHLSKKNNEHCSYVVFIGEKFSVMSEEITISRCSDNHLETLRKAVKNAPIFKVLINHFENKKFFNKKEVSDSQYMRLEEKKYKMYL
jgi:hypothetical protein